MQVDAFDFELPEERIALRPASPRESAKLLHVDPQCGLVDRHVRDLPDLLDERDVLVFNDTKVIPARLEGIRRRDDARDGEGIARISATLHMRAGPNQWIAFVRPGKRVRTGDRIEFAGEAPEHSVVAIVGDRGEGGEATLSFDRSGPDLDVAIAAIGHIPLPPYIASKRPDDERDRTDYQTIFARKDGAVAAPTAGLHFTSDLMRSLKSRGVSIEYLTLHVGAGTFLPVKVDDTADHRMHSEIGEVSASAAERLTNAKAAGKRIVSVGTTPLRLLESATDADGFVRPFSGPTDIFITPGYKFRAVDRLMTNFHLPRSTLFMLVSAFSGLDRMRAAYVHAVKQQYRFYSYGDACLLERVED